MSDDYLFTHDAAVSAYDNVETDGITVDDDGEASFDWNEIPRVELGEPPHQTAFDSSEFYKIEGATVARPIKQPYRVADDVEWYKKPADELRDAAWSADNKPYPLTHPDTGMVKATEDIHGFWKNPRYDGDSDRLKADLYVPTNDDEAKEFISDHQDVSVGFYNRVHSKYDGDTGDLTDDDVDGFQTDLYIDHIAGVERGRCSNEEGCGLTDDWSESFADESGGTPGELDDVDDIGKVVMETETPQVGQDEADTADSGVDDADEDGAASQTREVADPSGDESDDGAKGEDSADTNCTPCSTNNMTDTDGFDINVDLDDLSLDSLEKQFDAVADLREERDDAVETITEVREDLDEHGFDTSEDECPCETVDEVLHEHEDMQDTLDEVTATIEVDADELADEIEEMADALAEYREDEKEDALDELSELGADRDEWEDESLDEIETEIDRREEVLEDVDVDTKGVDPETDNEDTETETRHGKRRFGRGHAA